MRIELDRAKRITLLQWLRQGYIETADIEEIGNGGNDDVQGIPVWKWIEQEMKCHGGQEPQRQQPQKGEIQ